MSTLIDRAHVTLDKLTPAQRSALMRTIRKTNTRPEMVVRRLAHALGLRFRLHRRDLPGTPDLVLPRRRAVVMVHGCFWHQHNGCQLARKPRSRLDYWLPKLDRNQARDAEARERLEADGWRVVVIWECESKDAELVTARLRPLLEEAHPAR
jgi:DNA mismatch endonuclease (patch repair protein)